MIQLVSGWAFTVEAQVQCQAILCGICGEQRPIGHVFHQVLLFSASVPYPFINHRCYIILYYDAVSC